MTVNPFNGEQWHTVLEVARMQGDGEPWDKVHLTPDEFERQATERVVTK